jgi:coenzyme PQQ biosynthesis protein PqqD
MRISETGAVRPVLWKLARIGFDDVRNKPVLLYPEGAMLLNDTGAEILSLCDGQRTIEDIAATLGAKYGADVTADVQTYLTALVDRELVRDAD